MVVVLLTVTRVSMLSTTVPGPAQARRHAELGATSLVLCRVTRRIVAHDARVDSHRRVRGTFPRRRLAVARRWLLLRCAARVGSAAVAAVWL